MNDNTELRLASIERRARHAKARVESARVDLAEAAAQAEVSWERLGTLAGNLAEVTGYAEIWSAVYLVAKGSGVDHTALRDFLLQTMTQDPDDKWSGRSNDTRRRYNDGRRDAARAAHDGLQYGW